MRGPGASPVCGMAALLCGDGEGRGEWRNSAISENVCLWCVIVYSVYPGHCTVLYCTLDTTTAFVCDGSHPSPDQGPVDYTLHLD